LGWYVGALYLVNCDGCMGTGRFLRFLAVEATPLLNTLFLAALALLALVSGGILYLTALEWRDRRRQDRDKKLGR
jgi:hypothetical protein